MKNTLALIIFLTSAILSSAAEKPNIIVIMVDDLGYNDVGYNGCEDIPTPNIDRLAHDGAQLTSGYVTGAMCGPSRAGFITGKWQSTFGFYKNPKQPLNPTHGLPAGINTVASYMQQQGYKTGGVGKWHMGSIPSQHPNALGYDDWYGFLSGGRYYFPDDHPNYNGKYLKKTTPWNMRMVHHTFPMLHNYKVLEWDQYITRELTAYSLKFIDDNKENPFFLFVSYNAPHLELEAPEETIAKFPEDKMSKVPGVSPKTRSIYAAMTYEMDLGVGQIIQSLEEKGLLENTLIWFLSDNGGMKKTSDNRPLKGAKGSIHEGGLRVPFIAHWPNSIPKGSKIDHPVTSLDIGATAVAIAGGDLSTTDLHGVSLLPNLKGESTEKPHEEIYWSWSYHTEKDERGVYLKDGYKLILQKGEKELYYLPEDISENNNLAATKPEIVFSYYARWKELNQKSAPRYFTEKDKSKWAYQYANYEWLKGTPHYKENINPMDELKK